MSVAVRGLYASITARPIRFEARQTLPFGPSVTDVDGNSEDRVIRFPCSTDRKPQIKILDDFESESRAVGEWLTMRKGGIEPHEIGVFVRSEAQIDRAEDAVQQAGLCCTVLDEHVTTEQGLISVGTMHLAADWSSAQWLLWHATTR